MILAVEEIPRRVMAFIRQNEKRPAILRVDRANRCQHIRRQRLVPVIHRQPANNHHTPPRFRRDEAADQRALHAKWRGVSGAAQ